MAPLKYTCVEFYKGYSINLSFISICYLILKLSLSMQINKLHIRLTYITIKETYSIILSITMINDIDFSSSENVVILG